MDHHSPNRALVRSLPAVLERRPSRLLDHLCAWFSRCSKALHMAKRWRRSEDLEDLGSLDGYSLPTASHQKSSCFFKVYRVLSGISSGWRMDGRQDGIDVGISSVSDNYLGRPDHAKIYARAKKFDNLDFQFSPQVWGGLRLVEQINKTFVPKCEVTRQRNIWRERKKGCTIEAACRWAAPWSKSGADGECKTPIVELRLSGSFW